MTLFSMQEFVPISYEVNVLEPMLLWPEGAPGATGDGAEDRPKLTPYLPVVDAPSAAIVVCPGGGYCGRADHEGEPVARWLCSLGIAGCVVDYRVAPYRHPIPLGDAQRAIRLTRARRRQWNIDPHRVGILGFSAGGHCAISAATIFDTGSDTTADAVDRESCRPDALVACYPVVTFDEHRHDGSMRALLGEEPSDRQRELLSLERRVTRETPPTFLWHTASDPGVPVENSLLMAAALSSHGVPFALHVFPEGDHGLGLAEADPVVGAWRDLCARWLRQLGFGPARR